MARKNPLGFLESQKLYILNPEVLADRRRAAVHPEAFRESRLQGQSSDKKQNAPDPDVWAEISRDELKAGTWNGQSMRLMALTTDAGLGKSYNCLWLRDVLDIKPNLAFVMQIGELERKNIDAHNFMTEYLVGRIAEALGSKTKKTVIERALAQKQNSGKITLIFDGLDQSNSVDLIRNLLLQDDWSQCRFVVAGRPFAIDRHWYNLFEGKPWQFVQIGKLSDEQQRTLLGQERWNAIPNEARQILETPRILEFLADLQIKELMEMKTLSDVYYRATEHLLIEAFKNKHIKEPIEADIKKYRMLLSALAFSMYADVKIDDETGVRQPNLDRIPAYRMNDFLDEEVRPRLERAYQAKNKTYTEAQFWRDCEDLNNLNAEVNHGWLDARDALRNDLLWRNASLQEFLAAYWTSRWGQSEDHALLHEWLVDPLTGTNRAFHWFWRYAAEMPDRVIRPSHAEKSPVKPLFNWVNCMAPLYAVLSSGKPAVRSTEFIYRSWERMKGTQFQKDFLEEFPAIRNSKARDKKSREAKRIADEMTAGFIQLVGNPELENDTGTFWMGATKSLKEMPDGSYDPQDLPPEDSEALNDEMPHIVTLSRYKLHRYCVRNLEYELFCPDHRNYRWADDWAIGLFINENHHLVKRTGVGADDDCPVVYVSWYDAWVFAIWCGCLLPTEAQWEYACRAGTKLKFSLRDHSAQELTREDCNYTGNEDTWPVEDYKYYDRQIPGHFRGSEGTLDVSDLRDNRWGFFQMHGNVWEWCQDWYDENYYRFCIDNTLEKDPQGPEIELVSRIVRGGAWQRGLPCYLRVSCRARSKPDSRFLSHGFRLANPTYL